MAKTFSTNSFEKLLTSHPLAKFKNMDNHNQVAFVQCLILSCLLFLINTQVNSQENVSVINITYIKDAVAKGAVCLDGSCGAYYFAEGLGNGVNSWVVNLPSGGWCSSKADCLARATSDSGSTKKAITAKDFGQILSPKHEDNPDFYNWNRVFIRYCDGASFMADVEAVNPDTKLHLRGRRIFNTVMEELISKGMANATHALLIGESAGGLATILNCDRFHSFLPNTKVKCISDSGFFINAKDLPGANYREDYFANVTAFHELAKFLPQACTSRMAPGLCLFGENVVGDIRTPLFLLNSDFDQFQISINVVPNPPDELGWSNCTKYFTTIQDCTASQFQLIKDFQTAFLETLDGLNDDLSRGLYISSCYIHVFVYTSDNWQVTPTLENKTIAQALGDWYFERGHVQLIDSYPCPIDCNVTEMAKIKM